MLVFSDAKITIIAAAFATTIVYIVGDPHTNPGLTEDAFKTLFVARIVSLLGYVSCFVLCVEWRGHCSALNKCSKDELVYF